MKGTWHDCSRWACACFANLLGADVVMCGVCGTARPDALRTPGSKVPAGIRINPDRWQCACGPSLGNTFNNTLDSCIVCGTRQPAGAAAATECSVCWGTGFYHGHGGPCAEGCSPPAASVGLHVDEPTVFSDEGGTVVFPAAPPIPTKADVGELWFFTVRGYEALISGRILSVCSDGTRFDVQELCGRVHTFFSSDIEGSGSLETGP